MRRPHLSTGAWLFSGIVAAALITPAGVYAAVNSRVAIGNPGNALTATVTSQHQLMTTTVAPSQVVRAVTVSISAGCKAVYSPPAHKAIVVTSVIYNFGSGTNGVEHFGGLTTAGCSAIYDQIDGVLAYDTIEHTFPMGLPMPSVGITNSGAGDITVFVYGYLIDSSALPSTASSQVSHAVKGLSQGR
jgi:hypothetical protein